MEIKIINIMINAANCKQENETRLLVKPKDVFCGRNIYLQMRQITAYQKRYYSLYWLKLKLNKMGFRD